MSTQRYISTSFWTDKWIRTLDPSERYLYMYLLTNPQTNIAGVYQLTLDRIAFDTGYDERTLRPMLDRFAKAKKAELFDGEYMILPSWPKHQRWETKSKIRDGIVSCLQEVKKSVIDRAYDLGYQFDLTLIDRTIIARKQRADISGTTSRAVKEKYENKCAICGSCENLNIHHIKPIKEGGDNSFDNLQLLCQECHIKIHSPHTIYGKERESTYQPNYSDSDSDSDTDLDSDIDTEEKSPDKPAKSQKHKYGEYLHVLLTDEEYARLLSEWGEPELLRMIKELDEGIEKKGYKYKNHNLAIRDWKRNEGKNGRPFKPYSKPYSSITVIDRTCPICKGVLKNGQYCKVCDKFFDEEGKELYS